MDPITIIALIITGASALINLWGGIEDRNAEAEQLQEQRDAAAREHAASEAVMEAEWQRNMEDAQRAADKIARQRERLLTVSEENFDQSVENLDTAFGEGGTAWKGYEDLLISNESQRGALQAGIGASGLKNTGTAAMITNQADSAASRAESVTRRGLEGQMNAGIDQTTQAWQTAQFTASDMQTEIDQMETDWAGFDWERFTAASPDFSIPDPSNPESTRTASSLSSLQRLYAARSSLSDRSWESSLLRYDQAIDDQSNSFWRMGTDFFNGASAGMSLFNSAFKTFGVGGSTSSSSSSSSYQLASDPSYAYRGW